MTRMSLRMEVSRRLSAASAWCLRLYDSRQGKRPAKTLYGIKNLLSLLAYWVSPKWKVVVHKNSSWAVAWRMATPEEHKTESPDGSYSFSWRATI